jgi:hypothetical protein
MAGTDTPASASPEAILGWKISSTFSAAIATTLLAFQLQVAQAQTAPTTQSASASAPTDKRVGVWQYASNGESFEKFLARYGNGAIEEAEKLVDTGKWTEKDFDNFVKYRKNDMDKANVSKKKEWEELDQANVSKKKEWEELDQANVSLDTKIASTDLIREILTANANNDTKAQNGLRARVAWNASLMHHPILADFCRDYTEGKCPPMTEKHLRAINSWLATV